MTGYMTKAANTATYGTTNAIAHAVSEPCSRPRQGGRRDWLTAMGRRPSPRTCCVLLTVASSAFPDRKSREDGFDQLEHRWASSGHHSRVSPASTGVRVGDDAAPHHQKRHHQKRDHQKEMRTPPKPPIGAAGLRLRGLVAPGACARNTELVGENVPNVSYRVLVIFSAQANNWTLSVSWYEALTFTVK